jgi:superfamily II DNA helicase RecQ
MKLKEASAFKALRSLLAGDAQDDFECPEHPPFERLRKALVGEGTHSPIDKAVLIRHALLHENARRQDGSFIARLDVPYHNSLPNKENLETVGAIIKETDKFLTVQAKPWVPYWLSKKQGPIDLKTAQELEVSEQFEDTWCPDPFLKAVGKNTYRSPGQRAGVRSALTMPPGSTLLVCLPTGEGKSLIFQCLDKVGFCGSRFGAIPVIVPTVALALDHEKSCQEIFSDNAPRAYLGGDSERNQVIRKAIRDGTQGLYFLSPEAACIPLRETILEACENDLIGSLIIDEAHLVEGWGADFRTEYQLLSGLRAEMIAASRTELELRTILLSATLTQMAVDTLQTLFTTPLKPFGCIFGTRIRSEFQFFVSKPTFEEDRWNRVLEAVSRLPRPLILYVTTKKIAEDYYNRLYEIGYRSLALVHGGTNNITRSRILEEWRLGRLDMVVGTSAFGLGIDYPHIRSIVHACIPETLDRFYQEVGRGGRDGRTSISIIIPVDEDSKLARDINNQKIITIERGLQRWKAMFRNPDRKALGGSRHRVRLDVAPGVEGGDLDMVGWRSTDWNARVLTIMARAGILRILANHKDIDSEKYFIDVEIINDGHLSEDVWEKYIAPLRRSIRTNNLRSLELMQRYIRGKDCPGKLLKEIYAVQINGQNYTVDYDCGGCDICGLRTDVAAKGTLPSPVLPWGIPNELDPEFRKHFDHNGLLVVYYNPAKFDSRTFKRRLSEAIKALQVRGFCNLFVFEKKRGDVSSNLFSFAQTKPFFISLGNRWAHRLLPEGPEIILMLPGTKVSAKLTKRRPGYERIIFMPENMRDPFRPNELFSKAYGGADETFATFRQRIYL